MATITQLQVQKKNNDRINVFVDDKFFCGLTIDDMVKSNISVGMEVSEEFLANLLVKAGENDMYNKTLVYILRAPRTEVEIQRFLSRKKDCSPEMATRIITRLKTLNYINDEAYAKMFTASKHVRVSVRMIKQKLRSKGIKAENIANATADIVNQDELVKTVAEKYMRNKDIDPATMQKLYRYLVSKGFDYDIVNEIIEGYKSSRENFQEEYIMARQQLRLAKKNCKKIKKKIKGTK